VNETQQSSDNIPVRARTTTAPREARTPPPAPPAPLRAFEIEKIRVSHERTFASRIEGHPLLAGISAVLKRPDPKDERRRLMAESLRLSESMAPEAHQVAQQAQRVLGVSGTIELYQRSGPENAAMHAVREPILLEIHGALLPRLDSSALLALFGHELGHYLAHGPTSPHAAATRLPRGVVDDDALNAALSRFSMACELTADRVALLACQDLGALLRLMLVTVSGLAVGELTYDTEAYLAQCKDLIEADLDQGAVAQHGSHPEHGLRVYAAWLFSETRTYRDLTGRGPGTRELTEVDEVIARCFGASDGELHDPVQSGDVPREFLECALAAAVMVAHADGEISEHELVLIEQIFASEIADWQAYLDPQVATARFLETATVLGPSVSEFGPALLNLLFDIMLSDREIRPAEVAMVLDIGRVLGVGTQFARAMSAMFRQKGILLDLSTVEPPERPLPARRQDVDDALQTFLTGILRRGASTITLRRMLRLLGAERRNADALTKLQDAFARHHITAAPSLEQLDDLDARITLTPAAPAPVKASAPLLSGSRASLQAALRRLRDELVSGDGRSPSVRLREPRRGRSFDLTSLERVSVGMAERVMAQVRARKSVRIVDAADAGHHGPARTVSTELLALSREDTQCTEETGARDLFVGYPFVTGLVADYLVRAPLVLYPVELRRDGDGARGFRLEPRRDEPPIANQSLIRLLFNKRGFAFSDELSDQLEELAGDADGGPEAVRRALAEVGLILADGAAALQPLRTIDEEQLPGEGLFLEEAAALGLFPQSSSDLLQDYDGLLSDLARPDADVGALLAAAATLLPDSLVPSTRGASDATLGDWAPVIPADPSQRSVIAEARRHGATVVDGPPGTGKSQVIVNLVAEALRRGERVAVVCEKRAALDVVRQRMTAIGFGKTLAVVHDVHEDRKPLFAHIASRLESTARVPFAAAELAKVNAEHERVHAALGQRLAALHTRPGELDLTAGELLTFTAQQTAPRLPAMTGLDRIAQSGLRTLLDLATALHPLRELWVPTSRWRAEGKSGPRSSLATASPHVLAELEARLELAIAAAQRFEQHAAECPRDVTVEHVMAARAALELARSGRTMRSDPRAAEVFRALAPLASAEPQRLRETTQLQRTWSQDRAALLRLERPLTLDASPALTAAVSVLTRWSASWARVFLLGWWQARKLFRAELTRLWPERAGEALTATLLAEVRDRLSASRAWRVITEGFEALGLAKQVPATAELLGLAVEQADVLSDHLRALSEVQAPLQAAGAWLPADRPTPEHLVLWDRSLEQRSSLLDARDALVAALQPLRLWFPWLPDVPEAAALEELLAAWRRDGVRLAEADALLARARTLAAEVPRMFDVAAEAWRALPVAEWRAGVASAWATAWLARLEREQPLLASLGQGADDREVERLAARLRELEIDRRELEIERTLSQVDDTKLLTMEAAAKHQRRTAEQKLREELLKETRKQRMLMPLRTFVRRFAPAGMLDVTPVWLLSPETMAILFPRQPLFDLVVFDEASQCTVEAGLPVLLRARRVVIAGDEKQMPPSSYFSLGSAEDDESLGGTVDPDERHDVLRDLLTAESLLSLARPRVAHAGLAWHYRCRDEALIAFSNHAMYQGELLTVPSISGTAAPSALHWVPVADGAYNAGENVVEAQRVVDVVDELLGRTPRPSLGVVTFNLKQRKAVLDAVDARCATDAAFRDRWTDASALPLDERPFVRNLEQVQGDERDVIVFSLGHAPQLRQRGGVATGETYVPARFGPLGQRGGERRLNVAISRAKAACYLVASFDPAQLTVAASKHQGPRLFKHFLEFAHHHHHGRKLEAARVLDLVRGGPRSSEGLRHRLPLEGFVPLQTQLALALEAAGIPHELNVGASGFRIPVAILDPADPTKFALAVLLSEGTGTSDPFDWHVHRPGVLQQRQWQVLAISAASWRRRGSELIDEIASLVPGCRGAMTSEIYLRHRAALAQQAPHPRAAAAPSRPPLANPSVPDPSARPPSPEEPAVRGRSDRRDSAPVPALPSWALDIADEQFRAALLHLERHGVLSEEELTNMVGGPRRARMFARELDGWRSALPFQVETSVLGGAKSYRRGAAS
jgi:AAA domain/Protein of unknown function (DUF4011)